jgi:hypothetical protein
MYQKDEWQEYPDTYCACSMFIPSFRIDTRLVLTWLDFSLVSLNLISACDGAGQK